MTDTNCRLGRLVLVEHESGALRFSTHAALGMERSGNGYVLGNILVIGSWRRGEHGNLIDEFHEQRERLPRSGLGRSSCGIGHAPSLCAAGGDVPAGELPHPRLGGRRNLVAVLRQFALPGRGALPGGVRGALSRRPAAGDR